jgi:ribonuclease P protein component
VIRLKECVIFRVPNELGHFRLGITLKARGSSIERNRVKRQIRESFRFHAAILGSYDYNVVISGARKLAHPYHLKLGACLREDLPRGVAHAR